MKIVGQAKIQEHLDIAPLVDVVFLLLIFFMLTSSFLKPQSVDVQLPGSTTATPVSDDKIIRVIVTEDQQVHVNNMPVDHAQLATHIQRLLAQQPQCLVTLSADARLSVALMMQVMDLLRQGGARSVSLMTQPHAEANQQPVMEDQP
jgi:biopolymer transport protein ExbD